MAKAVIVTGISQGLGEAMFSQLIEAGRRPVGLGRRFTVSQRAAEAEGRCSLIQCDLASPKNLGLLTVPRGCTGVTFISNAGMITPLGLIGGGDFLDLGDALAVNLASPMILASQLASICRAMAIPLTILNISSGAAKRPISGWSAYCTAKAGAAMFFDCLAAENPAWTVRNIEPGMIDTGMQAALRASPFPVAGILKDPAAVAREILASL